MHENANASRQRAGDGHFVPAQKRHIEPAELPRRESWKLRIEVGGRGKDRARHITTFDAIAAN
jgi:hypothetical protein